MSDSVVALCNRALSLLGADQITTLEDNAEGPSNNSNAAACALWYDFERLAALESMGWRFATRTVQLERKDPLNASVDERSFYPLPTDFVRIGSVRDINRHHHTYRIEETKLFIGQTPTGSVVLEYVFDQTNADDFSHLFAEHVVARLAHRIGLGSAASPEKLERLLQLVRDTKMEALSSEGFQMQTEVVGTHDNAVNRVLLHDTSGDGDLFLITDPRARHG